MCRPSAKWKNLQQFFYFMRKWKKTCHKTKIHQREYQKLEISRDQGRYHILKKELIKHHNDPLNKRRLFNLFEKIRNIDRCYENCHQFVGQSFVRAVALDEKNQVYYENQEKGADQRNPSPTVKGVVPARLPNCHQK